jgi:hypothetical protein
MRFKSAKYSCLKFWVFIPLCLSLVGMGQTTTNEFQLRNSVEANIKLFKKLRINLQPELRLNEEFVIDNFQMNAGLDYSPWKIFKIGAAYRFIINPRPTKSTQYLHRFSVQARIAKWFQRFQPAFRFEYTNYTQDEEDGQFLRYKASVEYNIKKCKLTPGIMVEAYQQLNGNYLYKMRYGVSLDYDLFKNNSIELSYKFDDYIRETHNKHIVEVNYRIKL